MVLEITNENVYIGIIVVLAAIQIFQWRKVDMLERIMSQVIDNRQAFQTVVNWHKIPIRKINPSNIWRDYPL